jgi:hypothetical protein
MIPTTQELGEASSYQSKTFQSISFHTKSGTYKTLNKTNDCSIRNPISIRHLDSEINTWSR